MNKKLIAALFAFGIAFAPVAAHASESHQNQYDGCTHGNSDKPCKDDPQPDHGKDCDLHGNYGGINEDHCSNSTTTTTAPPVTTTTVPVVETTTTVPAPVVTTTTEPVVVTTDTTGPAPEVVVPTVPSNTCSDSNGFTFQTDQPCPGTAVVVQPAPITVPVQPVSSLPHTGFNTWLLWAGLVFLGSGLFSIAVGKFIAAGSLSDRV